VSNRLADASSPYLRQHRDNPVDWFPWGDEAFDEARRTGRPILLSVGYSACHWCHVMAHESFEDPATASVMNEMFINIKVDREERPDVDAVYMDAVQALTGRGGWPMTVFLTPQGEPFYGGTYYPRETFTKLMHAVDDAWKNRRDELQQNVDALVESIGRTALIAPAESINTEVLISTAVQGLRKSFDPTWGGFGSAPKFPSTFSIDLLLRLFQHSGDESLYEIARTSLDAMAAGGMYDQLGGGFCRYSVDEKWLVPHFEKMLYDQALLLRVYVHAWQLRGEPRDQQIAQEIINYVLRDLHHRDGGFFSAEDADSLDEHGHSEEGAFYTWTPDEIAKVLGEPAPQVCEYWEITPEGNFEGKNIPHRLMHRADITRPSIIEDARVALLAQRNTRSRPGLDDKVLTEWNAMMLSSLCEAASAFTDTRLIDAAIESAHFLVDKLRQPNGQWMRSWQADAIPQARHRALAHDLAHVVDAMTRMYELTSEHRWLNVAIETAHDLLDQHWDTEHGGLFTVSRDGEQLIVRQKDLMDNATASANSVAAMALLRLGALCDEPVFQHKAHEILLLLARVIPSAPSAFGNALAVILMEHHAISEVVLPGHNSAFIDVYREQWRPNCVLASGVPTESSLWTDRKEGLAYVCRQRSCQLPTSDPEEFRNLLTTT
jgi:uncharacterized protein YyaL (SSP411 family)